MRRLRRFLILAGLWSVSMSSASADDPGQRAIRILNEMTRLIEAILARNAKPAGTGAASSLFDGRSLGQWKRTAYAGGGDAAVVSDFAKSGPAIVVEPGATLSGIHWTGAVPRDAYEVILEFMKIEGSDFACALTFPVGETHATLVLGGWGGGVVGISSLDGKDASENETTTYLSFAEGRWYRVRLRVARERIEAWLDDKGIVNVSIRGRKVGLRYGEISRSTPLGLATYQTRAAFRAMRLGPITDQTP